MKAVVPEVSPAELARRKLTGIDRWDEMWEGVLHMAPAPYDEHQRILGELPGDETYDKFPFFAARGVREVVVIDRDSKKTEACRREGPQYVLTAPEADGSVPAPVLGVRFRREPGEAPLLVVEDAADPAQRAEI